MDLIGQITLFEGSRPEPLQSSHEGARYYQREAHAAIFEHLDEHRSTLCVLATALGKTHIFSMVVMDWGGPVLVLVHRDELLEQARSRLEKMTGERVEVEKADYRSHRARVVVGSVQTLCRKKRLERLGPGRFSLIVTDEAHHSTSKSYRKIYDYFAEAKLLGVTATPDRHDKSALGKVYESTAYVMDILDGIDSGFLTPIEAQSVTLEYDASDLKKASGDISAAQLDEKIFGVCNGLVDDVMHNVPGRQGIFFFPGVKSAEYAAERFNTLAPGSAICVHGKTDEDARRRMVADFRAGKHLYLCNCQVATEGFDAPEVSLIGIARLTMSRALYTQMVGRGLRVSASAEIDPFLEREHHAQRRASIAWSEKPSCMVRDYVGVGAVHTLCTPLDILGGKYTDAEKKVAKKKAKQAGGGDPRKHLESARRELQGLAKAKQRTSMSAVPYDPFQVFHMRSPDDNPSLRAGYTPPTPKQLGVLRKAGIGQSELDEMNLSKSSATRLITNIMMRWDKGLADYGQLRKLQAWGLSDVNISKRGASEALRYIASTGNGKSEPVDLKKLRALARGTGETQ